MLLLVAVFVLGAATAPSTSELNQVLELYEELDLEVEIVPLKQDLRGAMEDHKDADILLIFVEEENKLYQFFGKGLSQAEAQAVLDDLPDLDAGDFAVDPLASFERFTQGLNIKSGAKTKLAEPVRGSDDLEVELGLSASGREYHGMHVGPETTLDVYLYFPEEFQSSKVKYDVSEEAGFIELEDSKCSIKYRLKKTEASGAGPPGVVGKLELIKESIDANRRIRFKYHPPAMVSSEGDADYLHTSLQCPSRKDFKASDYVVVKRIALYPRLIFVIPGLWHPPISGDALMADGLRAEGYEVMHFEYRDTKGGNAGDIRDIARFFLEFIEGDLATRRSQGRQVDEVDIVAHSMGGLATRYMIGNLGASFVRMAVFLGTPHRGSPA